MQCTGLIILNHGGPKLETEIPDGMYVMFTYGVYERTQDRGAFAGERRQLMRYARSSGVVYSYVGGSNETHFSLLVHKHDNFIYTNCIQVLKIAVFTLLILHGG